MSDFAAVMMSADAWTFGLAVAALGLFGFLWKNRNGSHRSLTSSEERTIWRILHQSPHQIVANHARSSLCIKVKDLHTLREGEWLNDEVINFYLALLTDRNIKQLSTNGNSLGVLFLNSFFWTKLTENGYNYKNVKRWTKVAKLEKMGHCGMHNIFEMDKVIFPINVSNNHWCCGCINIKEKKFEFYDSMHGSAYRVFRIMRRYLIDEYDDKMILDDDSPILNLNEWTNYDGKKYAKQRNSDDCGVFTLKCCEFLSDGKFPTFTQADMPHFRRQIMVNIINRHVNSNLV